MKLAREDFNIISIEIDWDENETFYEYFIYKRIWYFFNAIKSNQFKLILSETGDSPETFKSKEDAEEYIHNLINKNK